MRFVTLIVITSLIFEAGCAPTVVYPPQQGAENLPADRVVTVETENQFRLHLIDGSRPQGEGDVEAKLTFDGTPRDRVTITPGTHRITVAYQNYYVVSYAYIEHDFIAGHQYFIGPAGFDVKKIKVSDATAKKSWIVSTGENEHRTSEANLVK